VTTDTAVARETAWLATITDALPYLPSYAGGAWDVVQGFWPGSRITTQKTGIYLWARTISDPRISNQRIRAQYEFTLKLIWPVKAQAGPLAETEQQNLATAVDAVVRRIRGLVGDKTHGGRFLSVAENPRTVTVSFEDAEATIPETKALYGSVVYRADDYEING